MIHQKNILGELRVFLTGLRVETRLNAESAEEDVWFEQEADRSSCRTTWNAAIDSQH